jgi:tRNA A37 N6-isopentenylltransferase MiaA
MNSPKTAEELLDQFYLHMRSALIETAAAFDRIQSGKGADAVWRDPRLCDLREAVGIIQQEDPERTRRILELLSVKEETPNEDN